MTEPPAPGLLRRLSDGYGHLLSFLLALSVAVLVLPVTLQIFARYTPWIPTYIWTEELSRFCLIWMIMIGAILAQKEGIHFIVDLFPELPPRGAAAMELVTGVFVLAFSFTFLWWGIEFVDFGWFRISELAEIPLWWIYLPWPVLGASWLVFQGERMWDAVRVLRDGKAA
jgi:TRAP-type C4-dicarboxylate transport system permease small subunit